MQTKQKDSALVWFRNDLRVTDQKSLYTACKKHPQVYAVYCFDPRHYATTAYGFKKTEKFRAQFLIESVKQLKQNLKTKLGIDLLVFRAKPEDKIPELVEKFNITALYSQKEWTEEEFLVYSKIKNRCSLLKAHSFFDQMLYHPKDIPFSFNQIPEVFTAFRKKVEKEAKVRACLPLPQKNYHQTLSKHSEAIPTLEELGLHSFEPDFRSAFPFKGGEQEASKRIQDYFWKTQKLSVYKKTRNELLGADYSSKLSAWLAKGCISARQIYWEVKNYEKEITKNESTYWLIFELLWRDFFKYISLKHGNAIFKQSGIRKEKLNWHNNPQVFEQWRQGKTAEPFVNANMIELAQTGFMSNRGRQNINSYWAKELRQDWRIGAAYLESMLIDYDVHSNWGNWMYNSGVGNDPRDRKFNIKSQANRYDASGKYQQTWLQNKLFS
jgi:deoxyribodipyrimidine photo-lyase